MRSAFAQGTGKGGNHSLSISKGWVAAVSMHSAVFKHDMDSCLACARSVRRQQARNRPVVGEDRTYSLQVDFLDAVFGTSTEIEVRIDLRSPWQYSHLWLHMINANADDRSTPQILIATPALCRLTACKTAAHVRAAARSRARRPARAANAAGRDRSSPTCAPRLASSSRCDLVVNLAPTMTASALLCSHSETSMLTIREIR